MAINLTVLMLIDRFMHFIHPQIISVAERILGILLAALSMQTVIDGFVALGVLEATGGHYEQQRSFENQWFWLFGFSVDRDVVDDEADLHRGPDEPGRRKLYIQGLTPEGQARRW